MSNFGLLCCINMFAIRWRKGTFGLSWLTTGPTDHEILGYQSRAYLELKVELG